MAQFQHCPNLSSECIRGLHSASSYNYCNFLRERNAKGKDCQSFSNQSIFFARKLNKMLETTCLDSLMSDTTHRLTLIV